MKKILFIGFLALAAFQVKAQKLNPVKWTTQIEKKSEGYYVLTFNGMIDTGWHLYSQFTAEGGSLPLEVLFKNQKGNFELIGKTKESKTKTAYNDIFEVNETFFDPNYIAQVRKKLKLDQREAAEIFGGGVNAFSRYENGKTKPPLALVKLLKVLERHPDLLSEVRTA